MPMAAAPASAEGEKWSLKDQGNEFFKSGKYLKAAIKQDPSNPTTLHRYLLSNLVTTDYQSFHIKVDHLFKIAGDIFC